MSSTCALSSLDEVQVVANRFSNIADLLHRRLNRSSIESVSGQSSTELYRLLVEEYGLRVRASILRNDALAHTMTDSATSQTKLLELLDLASKEISDIDQLSKLRTIIVCISTLCVAINPGRGRVVDFLVSDLNRELQLLGKA